MVAALMIANLAVRGPSTPAQLGLSHPLRGAAPILLSGAILCGVILLMGSTVRFAGAGHGLPWDRSWQYLIWALAQEFILQSTFYVRLEMIFAPRHASLIAAGLFSLAHIPSPVLTLLSFVGGFFFSWLFGRFRNLYALGAIHGALGLTIASCLPDAWLHHMRVGLGYLTHS
ncbi:MAG: CPBP family intramembrane metalloprotease [Acidobacteria bacterium]|nr:CPBP family intramembrane metalloprotease [Acidobacteriota bacterium]